MSGLSFPLVCLQAEFGEFRATILGMLETYKYEQRILRTANNLMEDDVRKRVRVLHRVRWVAPHPPVLHHSLHPSAVPRSLFCLLDSPSL